MIEKTELTNDQLIGVYQAVIKIKQYTPKASIKFKHALDSNLRNLTPIVKTYDELRLEVAKKYGKKGDKDGEYIFDDKGSYIFEGEDYQNFVKEFMELLQQVVSVDIYKLSVDEIGSYEVDEEENPTIGTFLQFCIKD